MQPDKYNSIADHLEQRIVNGEFTHRLPPSRQLTSEYAVSKRTFDKAMKRLKEAGFILPGARGTLLNPDRRPRKRSFVIAAVCDKTFSAVASSNYLLNILQQKAAAAGFAMQTITISEVKDFQADGFVFFGCYDHQLTEELHQKGIAAVSLNMQADDSFLSYTDLSYSDALIRSINALTSRGVNRIAFYHPLSKSSEGIANWKKLYTEFVSERKAFMLKLPELDFFVPHSYNNGQEFVDFLCRQKAFPQVILQLNWHSELYEALTARNIIPGQDCRLMSLFITREITQRWADSAWELLVKRIHNAYAEPDKWLLPLKGEFVECNFYEDYLKKANR